MQQAIQAVYKDSRLRLLEPVDFAEGEELIVTIFRQSVSPLQELFEFLLSKPTPEQIIEYQGSKVFQDRVRYLLDKNRNDTLTAEEGFEIDEFSRIGYFVTKLKLQALEELGENKDTES